MKDRAGQYHDYEEDFDFDGFQKNPPQQGDLILRKIGVGGKPLKWEVYRVLFRALRSTPTKKNPSRSLAAIIIERADDIPPSLMKSFHLD